MKGSECGSKMLMVDENKRNSSMDINTNDKYLDTLTLNDKF